VGGRFGDQVLDHLHDRSGFKPILVGQVKKYTSATLLILLFAVLPSILGAGVATYFFKSPWTPLYIFGGLILLVCLCATTLFVCALCEKNSKDTADAILP